MQPARQRRRGIRAFALGQVLGAKTACRATPGLTAAGADPDPLACLYRVGLPVGAADAEAELRLDDSAHSAQC
jgi:hypothetical protein